MLKYDQDLQLCYASNSQNITTKEISTQTDTICDLDPHLHRIDNGLTDEEDLVTLIDDKCNDVIEVVDVEQIVSVASDANN